MSMRIAAFLAGLGEIGYSKVFLSKEFGPRVRIACVFTDMELEPDPIIPPGTLCNRAWPASGNVPVRSFPRPRP